MKQNITLSVDKSLLKRARSLAAQRGASVSSLLAEELRKLVERDSTYQQAKQRALSRLGTPFHLGGAKLPARESLHERKDLR
jgi:post-segregation antitoxin (ccd killing protein)